MTRAKKVFRIVGDLDFWSNGSSDSIIGKLAEHCKERGFVSDDPRLGPKKKRMEAWIKPCWGLVKDCTWKPSMTALFHDSVKKLLHITEKNIAFNTLIKVALPSEKDIYLLPTQDTDRPKWQMSALKGYEKELQIVWCAKEGGIQPIIEAHFAGSHDKCLHYIQTHPALPKGSARVKSDLSGVESPDNTLGQSQNIELSWTLTKSIGNAMLDTAITELPEVSSNQ